MTKKNTSFPAKSVGRPGKNYKQPQWIKILRVVGIFLLSVILLLAIIGMILHALIHFK